MYRIAVAVSLLLTGCASQLPDRAVRMTRGYVYYLDGAGGGGALHNYSAGVRQGLLDAGYPGAGEMFDWETGLGLTVDQIASVEYKRDKAAQLALRVREFGQQYPQTPVTMIGFSAGTAVAAFTLEALPPEVLVETAIMLSGSLSSEYDLTAALEHVRGRMYVSTSHRDEMLQFLMRLTGTADREPTSEGSIGADGVRLPPNASAHVREQYGKVVIIPWNEDFARLGDRGRHFDAVNPRFIQAIVAPLVMRNAAPATVTAAKGMVPNPDYERWAGFAPGSWAVLRGYQVMDGVRTPLTIRNTLVARDEQRLVVEREFHGEEGSSAAVPLNRRLVVAAQIDPREHPATAPQHTRVDLPPETVEIGGKAVLCSAWRLRAVGNFSAWGTDVDATVYTTDTVPGHMARVELKTNLDGKPAEFSGALVEFRAVR